MSNDIKKPLEILVVMIYTENTSANNIQTTLEIL